MTRPTHDLVTERARRLAERQRRREAFQQAAHEIRSDRSFSNVIRRVAEESLRLQQTHDQDDGSSLSSLRETELILQALASGEGEAEAFSAYESDSEGGYNVHTNYRSSNDTPGGPEDDRNGQTRRTRRRMSGQDNGRKRRRGRKGAATPTAEQWRTLHDGERRQNGPDRTAGSKNEDRSKWPDNRRSGGSGRKAIEPAQKKAGEAGATEGQTNGRNDGPDA